MNLGQFKKQIESSTPEGTILENPGGGTSEIIRVTNTKISYKRGSSTIKVSFDDLHTAYVRFTGRTVTSSELKKFAPNIFDSTARPAGHSCNCTFLFLLLSRIHAGGKIQGAGIRGNPFALAIYDS